jgi:hypothetical protein
MNSLSAAAVIEVATSKIQDKKLKIILQFEI